MREIECSTQEELDAAVLAGDIAVVRRGEFTARGSARVDAYGSASVYNGVTKAALRRARPRVVICSIGSRNDALGVSLPENGSDPYVYAGCWNGTLADFEARIARVYPTGQFGDEYRAAIAFIRTLAAVNEEAGK